MLLAMVVIGCSSRPEQETPVAAQVSQPLSQARLLAFYSEWQGVPYRLGGMNKRGVDCSAFSFLVYRDLAGLSLPRTVEDQLALGRRVSEDEIQSGDLVFFKTGWTLWHVGVSLGDRRFVHASTSQGVIISTLDNGYWQQKFRQIRRYD
ncbi:C40 family peptidase [Shewanella zhangzhouensis]|nr:C40 family peptidase [Shewanella zhangzhouensis]